MLEPALPMKLVVINYCMDENHPLLSHQFEAVRSLAQFFDVVHVVSSQVGKGLTPRNVTVKNLNWKQGHAFRNTLNLLIATLPLLVKKNVVLFSHMTDVQAAIISPFAKALRVKHIQWYAHKTYSRYLRFSKLFVDAVVTSTPGSCPISGKRVFPIGQALIPESFEYKPRNQNEFKSAVHIGRFDPSKDIELLAQTCMKYASQYSFLSLTQIGSPATTIAGEYVKSFEKKFSKEIAEKSIIICSSIPRSEISATLRKFDFFIHAYVGSLDKTLLESTMSGVPVVTINPEYHAIFGTWSGLTSPTLWNELESLQRIAPEELTEKLLRRREICELNHSLDNWTDNLLSIFSAI